MSRPCKHICVANRSLRKSVFEIPRTSLRSRRSRKRQVPSPCTTTNISVSPHCRPASTPPRMETFVLVFLATEKTTGQPRVLHAHTQSGSTGHRYPRTPSLLSQRELFNITGSSSEIALMRKGGAWWGTILDGRLVPRGLSGNISRDAPWRAARLERDLDLSSGLVSSLAIVVFTWGLPARVVHTGHGSLGYV
ncbi:hypothetical protein FA13DRAFT_1516901 [Coprinellus micaceus]|uniref:Uncharacterized protein n=1 Tax=Coprinellus micaceus TaxID=71717 RepID=A0A4Y7SKP3_COPMI|nr:hypothetical protein FA13DRAFT_1516901 [Coprinellus micaceus]